MLVSCAKFLFGQKDYSPSETNGVIIAFHEVDD